MLGCLDVELSEGLPGQVEGGLVEVVGLLEILGLNVLVMGVNGNLLQDQGCRDKDDDDDDRNNKTK